MPDSWYYTSLKNPPKWKNRDRIWHWMYEKQQIFHFPSLSHYNLIQCFSRLFIQFFLLDSFELRCDLTFDLLCIDSSHFMTCFHISRNYFDFIKNGYSIRFGESVVELKKIWSLISWFIRIRTKLKNTRKYYVCKGRGFARRLQAWCVNALCIFSFPQISTRLFDARFDIRSASCLFL